MYEETGCFESNPNMPQSAVLTAASENDFSQTIPHNISALPPPQHPPQPLMAGSTTNSNNSFEDNLSLSVEELTYQHHSHHYNHHHQRDAMDMDFQQQMAFINNNNNESNNPHAVGEVISESNHQVGPFHHSISWNPNNVDEIQEMSGFNGGGHNQHHHHPQEQQLPDLLNLFNLSRCSASSLLPNSPFSFTDPSSQKIMNISNLHNSSMATFLGDLPMTGIETNNSSAAAANSHNSILYDPLFHLNLPPQPPMFRELFQSGVAQGYNGLLPASSSRTGRGGSLFGEIGEEREGISGGMYEDGDGSSGVLEFSREMGDCIIGKGRDGKMTKHFATERQRRVQLNDKYKALRSLVPNPTKTDRASIVGDAIEYIKELLRTVKELKILVEKKRCSRERSKRQKKEDDGTWDLESSNMKPLGDTSDQSYNLRSSWLQRKSKDTEVDVRIIDDEVTIKLVQRKVNCLLIVSKVLDDLQLDLHHVAGGHIGDYYSFLFNTKIYEGSSVYASAIANKLIEVVDRQYAATPTYQ